VAHPTTFANNIYTSASDSLRALTRLLARRAAAEWLSAEKVGEPKTTYGVRDHFASFPSKVESMKNGEG